MAISMAYFGPTRRVSNQPKKSKIMKMSRKDLWVTQSNMQQLNRNPKGYIVFKNNKAKYSMETQGWSLNSPRAGQYLQRNKSIDQLNVKRVDNLATSIKSARKSYDILAAKHKDMNQPTALRLKNSLIADEKQKAPILLMSKVDVCARSKELHASKKDERYLEISPPTHLKAMVELTHKAPSRLTKRPISNQGEDIIAREARAKKLKSLKSIELHAVLDGSNTMMMSVPNKDKSNEGKERQDEIVAYKGNDMNHIGEGHAVCAKDHKMEGIQKAKQSPSLTLLLLGGNQHMQDPQSNSRNNSSYIFGSDLSRCKSDKALLMEDNQSMGANQRESNKRKEPLLEKKLNTNEANDVPIGTNKDEYEEAQDSDNNSVGMKDHVGKRTSQAAISHDGHMVASCVDEQRCPCCSKPIDKPTWSGIFKIDDKEYASLVGHLSSKSCEKVWKLSRQLRPLVAVKKLPRSMVWPKAWETSKPNGDNIGLYFFPHDMRKDEYLNQLVKEVMENDLALRAIIGEAEMLIFPSSLLPNRHQTFQRKHYLWGIFKPRKDKGAVVAKPLMNEGPHAQRVEKGKQLHVSKQQDETEALHHGVHSVEASPVATATMAASNHGQADTRTEHPPGRLMSIVVRQTPKVEQLIREMERDGTLVYAVQGERIDAGSWSGSMAASTVQK